ncbi:MAG: class I SAM-dependent methyltransferase [Planctomycetota bacterium]
MTSHLHAPDLTPPPSRETTSQPKALTTTTGSDLLLLRQFLEAYWLRPENALWMTLRSRTLARQKLNSPSLDVSCGDGVFMFLHCGGVLDSNFDVFADVRPLDRDRDERDDMFDHLSDRYAPGIVAPPSRRIDAGTDWKKTLLAKADRLGLYEKLIHHDNEEPLPFPAESFATIYCNAAYWVRHIDGFLSELRRVVRPDGRVILQVKLDHIRRYTLEAFESQLGRRFLEIIGRGRADCWPTLASRPEWEARFQWAGLRIQEATPFVTRTHAHVWDVGLRPIAPLLVRMVNELTPAPREAIKKDWIDLFCELLAPLCRPDFDLFASPDEPAEIQYVLCPA